MYEPVGGAEYDKCRKKRKKRAKMILIWRQRGGEMDPMM